MMVVSVMCEREVARALEEANDNQLHIATEAEIMSILEEFYPGGVVGASPTAVALANDCPLIASHEPS